MYPFKIHPTPSRQIGAIYGETKTKQMRIIIFFLFGFLSTFLSAQTFQDYENIKTEYKRNSKIDSSDKSALNILISFYEEVHQATNGSLSELTLNTLTNFLESKKSKNKHLIQLFFIYQDYITECASKNIKANSDYQIKLIEDIENEITSIYKLTPTIISIYKYESYELAKTKKKALETVQNGLLNNPKSIPLKVYLFLLTNDEKIKQELIQNHSSHWLVKQNNIK